MDRTEVLTAAYRQIIEQVDDINRPGVLDTPKRAAVAMEFLTRGYEQTLETVVNNALFETDDTGFQVMGMRSGLFEYSITDLQFLHTSAGKIMDCFPGFHPVLFDSNLLFV